MAHTAEAVRVEMRHHVGSIIALAPESSRKAALWFASKVLGLPFGRVRSLYYGEARRIDAHEADQVRAYVRAAHELIAARADYETKRREFLAEAHPIMARLVPPALEPTPQEVAAAASRRGGR